MEVVWGNRQLGALDMPAHFDWSLTTAFLQDLWSQWNPLVLYT